MAFIRASCLAVVRIMGPSASVWPRLKSAMPGELE